MKLVVGPTRPEMYAATTTCERRQAVGRRVRSAMTLATERPGMTRGAGRRKFPLIRSQAPASIAQRRRPTRGAQTAAAPGGDDGGYRRPPRAQRRPRLCFATDPSFQPPPTSRDSAACRSTCISLVHWRLPQGPTASFSFASANHCLAPRPRAQPWASTRRAVAALAGPAFGRPPQVILGVGRIQLDTFGWLESWSKHAHPRRTGRFLEPGVTRCLLPRGGPTSDEPAVADDLGADEPGLTRSKCRSAQRAENTAEGPVAVVALKRPYCPQISFTGGPPRPRPGEAVAT